MALAFVPIVCLRPDYIALLLHPIVARIPGIVPLLVYYEQTWLNGDYPIQVKVLGVTLSSDLSWNSHADRIVSKARKRVFLIYQLKRAGMGAV